MDHKEFKELDRLLSSREIPEMRSHLPHKIIDAARVSDVPVVESNPSSLSLFIKSLFDFPIYAKNHAVSFLFVAFLLVGLGVYTLPERASEVEKAENTQQAVKEVAVLEDVDFYVYMDGDFFS